MVEEKEMVSSLDKMVDLTIYVRQVMTSYTSTVKHVSKRFKTPFLNSSGVIYYDPVGYFIFLRCERLYKLHLRSKLHFIRLE